MKAVAVSLCEPLLLLLLLMNVLPLASTQDARMPPSVTRGPVMQKYYKVGANVTLECEGVGNPNPSYEWLKNGAPLNVNTGNIQIRPGVGTIDIKSCTETDEGYYQCILTNTYGKTMSNTTFLQKASLDPFPGDSGGIHPYTADLNGHVCILCQPTLASIPAADIYWKFNYTGIPGKPQDVIQNGRIQTDPFTGSLCLTMIEATDGTADRNKVYICNVENAVLQTIHQGSFSRLTTTSTVMGDYAPLLTFSSSSAVIGIEGEGMTLRCFFSGNPLPNMSWKKDGQLYPQNRWETTTHSNTGLRLSSGKLQQADAGLYACEASNRAGPTVIYTMQLSVEVRPVFQDRDAQPHDVNVTESETVNISCNPRAIPEVTIRWFKNQVEFTAANLPPKMNLSADLKTLTIVDVCKKCYDGNSGDLMVIQCNASNQHGYSFAQGYINVLMATVITSVGGNRAWIAYQNEVFDAEATTDDSTGLTHTWTKDGYTIQVSETIYVAANGSLVILTQNDTDGGQGRMGEYKCVVSNGFSQAEIVYIYGEPIVVQTSEPYWIIGLVIGLLLLLLLLLLLIFCCCCNNEGDSYPVDKNERKNGNIPEKELKDIGFQSYLSEDYAAAGAVVVAVAPPVMSANDSYSSKGAMYMGAAGAGVEASMAAVKYDNSFAVKTTMNVEGGAAVIGSTGAAGAYKGGGKLEGDSDEDEAFHEGDDRSSISTVAGVAGVEASGYYNSSSAAVVRTKPLELSPASLVTQQQQQQLHFQQHGNYHYDINDGGYHGAAYLGGHQASAATAVVQSRYSVRYTGGSDEQYGRNELNVYAPVPPPRSRRSSSASSKQVQDYNAFKTSEV